MEFLKNHYEKVLLAAVLLGVAVALALLPMKIPEAPPLGAGNASANVPPLNLVTNEGALNLLSNLPPVVLSGTNNLLNPVNWRRLSDGTMLKIDSDNVVGPGAVQYLKYTPLYLIISFDNVTGSNYVFGVIQEAHHNANLRGKKPFYVGLNETCEFFKLVEVNGPPENPTDLAIQLNDTKEKVTLAKDKPYKRIAGFMADVKYAPKDKAAWQTFPPNRRVGDPLVFDGDTNNIVDINSNVVVLSARSTGKRTTIKLNAAP